MTADPFREKIDELLQRARVLLRRTLMGKLEEVAQQGRDFEEVDLEELQEEMVEQLLPLREELEEAAALTYPTQGTERDKARRQATETFQNALKALVQKEMGAQRHTMILRKKQSFDLICATWFDSGYKNRTSYSEIQDKLGIPKVGISRCISELSEDDLLDQVNGVYEPSEDGLRLWAEQKGIVLTPETVLLLPLSTVAAGMSVTEAEEIVAGTHDSERTYPVFFRDHPRNPEELFVLRVDGDSMRDAHILHGDLLLVSRFPGGWPSNGQMTIAGIRMPNQTLDLTVKHFYRAAKERIELRPANPDYTSIFADEEDVLIFGTPIRVIRELE